MGKYTHSFISAHMAAAQQLARESGARAFIYFEGVQDPRNDEYALVSLTRGADGKLVSSVKPIVYDNQRLMDRLVYDGIPQRVDRNPQSNKLYVSLTKKAEGPLYTLTLVNLADEDQDVRLRMDGMVGSFTQQPGGGRYEPVQTQRYDQQRGHKTEWVVTIPMNGLSVGTFLFVPRAS